MSTSGGLSVHCVDVARGRVAAGLQVILRRLQTAELIAEGQISSNGLLSHPALMSSAITAGGYEVCFEVGAFYRAQGLAQGLGLSEPGFLETVPYRFHISDERQHYHLPFKFTPWGYSLFRGGA